MKPGNTAATGINQGDQASSSISEPDCEELNKRNTALRDQLKNDSSQSIRSAFGSNGATTVAHASLNGGAPIPAASRLLPLRYKDVAEGLWAEKDKVKRAAMRKSRRSNVCPEAPFTYSKAARPHQSHCESKILETLFAGSSKPSGSLLLNINWQSESDPNSKDPCAHCEKLLCHAQQKCGITILFCQAMPTDAPQPLDC